MVEDFSIERLASPRRGLRLVGELDLAAVPELADALALLDGAGDVTLDLSGLTFIDGTGLGAIVDHAGSLAGAKLVLVGPTAMSRRIFEIVGLEALPPIVVEAGGDGR
jgi:anti-anti-sigma factor